MKFKLYIINILYKIVTPEHHYLRGNRCSAKKISNLYCREQQIWWWHRKGDIIGKLLESCRVNTWCTRNPEIFETVKVCQSCMRSSPQVGFPFSSGHLTTHQSMRQMVGYQTLAGKAVRQSASSYMRERPSTVSGTTSCKLSDNKNW